jgi:hypothetical protein
MFGNARAVCRTATSSETTMATATRSISRLAKKAYHVYIAQRYIHDFVFIHINKTGGSSIDAALGMPTEHNTAREKIRQIGRGAWDRKFTFTIVRNPWDKVVSHYHYRLKTNQTNLKDDPIPFAEWVQRTYGEQDPKYYDKPKMFMPQVDWISDDKGEILVNFVGRFERLNEDFGKICKRLNRQADLPHVKQSNRGQYADYYDETTREIVSHWFRDDIEQFNYSF